MTGLGRFLVVVGLLTVAACSSNNAPAVDPADVMASAQMTAAAVNPILEGDEDFAGAIPDLDAAIALDPNNDAAKFFRALFEYLAFLKFVLFPPQPQVTGPPPTSLPREGQARDLLWNAGVVNINEETRMLRDICWCVEDRGQGMYPDTIDGFDAFDNFAVNYLMPAQDRLTLGMAGLTRLDYTADITGGPFTMGGPRTVHVDYGDAELIRAWSLGMTSGWRICLTYDFDNFNPNTIDPEDDVMFQDPDFTRHTVLTMYPNLLTPIRPSWSTQARLDCADSYAAYLNASNIILNETPTRRDQGLITYELFPTQMDFDCFRDQTDPTVRVVGGQFVSASSNPNATFSTVNVLPPGWEFTIRPYYMFESFNLNTAFVQRQIIDPRTGLTTIGVNNIGDYDSGVFTWGNVLVDPLITVGDLTTDCYMKMGQTKGGLGAMLRLDTPSTNGNIVLDGQSTEWTAGTFDTIRNSPNVKFDAPRPDLGNNYLTTNNDVVYLWIDDPAPNLGQLDQWDVRFTTGSSFGAIFWDGQTQSFQPTGTGVTFGYAAGGGLEIMFVTPSNETWGFVSSLYSTQTQLNVADYFAAVRIRPDE